MGKSERSIKKCWSRWKQRWREHESWSLLCFRVKRDRDKASFASSLLASTVGVRQKERVLLMLLFLTRLLCSADSRQQPAAVELFACSPPAAR